jgi:hypothetical protein
MTPERSSSPIFLDVPPVAPTPRRGDTVSSAKKRQNGKPGNLLSLISQPVKKIQVSVSSAIPSVAAVQRLVKRCHNFLDSSMFGYSH